MKQVLIVGSGGREHALAWKLRQSPQVGRVYVAPGNGGTSTIAENVSIAETDLDDLVRFVRERHVDLTVVGPEVPLQLGLADRLSAEHFRVFGPSAAAARLETSKVFAKDFMARHRIPTAPYRTLSKARVSSATLSSEAQACVEELGLPVAVKADGLAAGKGVVLCHTLLEVKAALVAALVEDWFGPAGHSVVVETGLTGEEVSILAFSDANRAIPLVAAQDHKAVFDEDRGPNTGGMGSYAPVPFVDAAAVSHVVQTILQPAVEGMSAEGCPFQGILYAGLMLTAEGPQVLEFNARFGDPETQVILPLLQTDLLEVLDACTATDLGNASVDWLPGACVCVVCASQGYPGPYRKGLAITGLDQTAERDGVMIFHAGTSRNNGTVVTNGGRVLGVTGYASDLPSAIETAYRAVSSIHFEGMHYRKDIGAKALRSSEQAGGLPS